ncbi:MAG: sialate O-acetylesterase [Candidatus Izemoplasmatales bacterium]
MKPHFTLASIFTDHMMFQAGKPSYIFGKCLKRQEIRIRINGSTFRYKTTDTTFCFELPAMPYIKEPFDFEVVCQNQKETIHNCLVGDIFIVSGQTNMKFPLKDTYETKVKENPNIRLYQVPALPYANAHLEFPDFYTNNAFWDTCNFESAMKFSAIGYFVAQILQKEQNTPIGIISCCLDDSSILSWAGIIELSQTPEMQKYLSAYLSAYGKYRNINEYSDAFNSQLPKWYHFVEEIQANIRAGMTAEKGYFTAKKNNPSVELPMGPKHYNRPAGAFETMVSTITPFSVCGVLFYQGESDCLNAAMYEDAFKTMITSWRRGFQDIGLPFVLVQVAGYSYPDMPETASAIIRESQAKCINFANNIFMTTAADLGEENYLCPREKTVLANRLASVVLEKIYHCGKNTMAPALFSYRCVEGNIIIYTEYNNLNLVSRSKRNLGFKITKDEITFENVETDHIELSGNQIIIKDVKNIKEIRYNFTNFPHLDIYSTNDLPLLPFRIKITA